MSRLVDFIQSMIDSKSVVVQTAREAGTYDNPTDYLIREYQSVGFHVGRGMGKSAFILEWVRRHPDTLVIPKNDDTYTFLSKYIPDNAMRHLTIEGPRPIHTIPMEYAFCSKRYKYIILEDADSAFTYGRCKKKTFYKWVANNFGIDTFVILAS